MANYGYMTIKGETQDLISESCSTRSSIGNKCQPQHADQIMVLAFTHNMANTDNSRHATHRPVFITKNVDRSSPLLSQALDKREKIDCTIDFYRTTEQGAQEKFYTVQLHDGLIREIVQDMPHVLLQNEAQAQEHISISYRDITWTHHAAGTYGHAAWSGE